MPPAQFPNQQTRGFIFQFHKSPTIIPQLAGPICTSFNKFVLFVRSDLGA